MRKRWPRTWTPLTEEQVHTIVNDTPVEQFSKGGMGEGPYMPPYSEALNGVSMTFAFPEGKIYYEFVEKNLLRWHDGDGNWHDEFCFMAEFEPGIFFIRHIRTIEPTRGTATLVWDRNTGLVTICREKFGNYRAPREIDRDFWFGEQFDEAYPREGEKHHYDDTMLVGKSIRWSYFPDREAIQHIYSSPLYYTYVMRPGDMEWIATNPANYVKINDHLCIFSFIEERQTGVQGFFLINTETLHDVGAFLGVNGEDKFECYMVGAVGELVPGDFRL